MKAFIYWSGGKDAAMAYHAFEKKYGSFPDLLVSRVTNEEIVAAHEVSLKFIETQAKVMGRPLEVIKIPAFASNSVYETIMLSVLTKLKNKGYTHAVFGDIFLEDLKKFHTLFHHKYGIECVFPLWGNDTKQLANEIIAAGIKPIVTAVNTKYLSTDAAGQEYNQKFINGLPAGVDTCGENGEFHTLVYDAPYFSAALPIKKSEDINKITYHKGTAYETEMAYVTLTYDGER